MFEKGPAMSVKDRREWAGGAGTGHPDIDMLAAYTDRKLDAETAGEIERHASVCADCRDVLSDTTAFLEAEEQGARSSDPVLVRVVDFRRRRWMIPAIATLAAAAALVLAVRTVPSGLLTGWFGTDAADGLPALIAAAESNATRFVEGRLSGDFPYAPAPSVTRGGEARQISPDVSIAAARIEQLGGGETAASLSALGAASLAIGAADRAVTALERAAALSPDDAAIASDLAAAYLERGKVSPADYGLAVSAAERAIRLPNPPLAAWFNHALALERNGDDAGAVKAWTTYLERDPASPWAKEAARHLEGAR
jgi:tetratricopeptide (TPR) repeat protein